MATYHHDLLLLDLQLTLEKCYPEAKWVSERQLRQQQSRGGIGKKGHMADAVLHFQHACEPKQIAIELELTFKSRDRLTAILKQYGAQFDIHEVWYYCPDNVATYLREVAAKWPFIKIHALPEQCCGA